MHKDLAKLFWSRITKRSHELAGGPNANWEQWQQAASETHTWAHNAGFANIPDRDVWIADVKASIGFGGRDAALAGHRKRRAAETHEDGAHATIRTRYLQLVQSTDLLPPDTVLNAAMGAKNGTISSIRSELRKNGYEFHKQPDGGYSVTRPAPVITSREPARMVESAELALLKSIDAHLEHLVTISQKLLAVWNGDSQNATPA